MPLDLTDDKSTLVQVMAWCRQATSHYLSLVDPDLCRHMVSLSHNELRLCSQIAIAKIFILMCRFIFPEIFLE